MIYGKYGEIECEKCHRFKYWYNFPVDAKGNIKGKLCFVCVERTKIQKASSKLYELIMAADKNKMVDLRNHLFQCLEMVKSKQMAAEEAKAACMIAQTIINSAKLGLEFIKLIGNKKSEFFQIEDKIEN